MTFFTSLELFVYYIGFKLFILSELIIFLSLFSSFLNYIFIFSLLFGFFIILFSLPLSNLFILLYSSFSIQSSLLFIKLSYLLNVIEGYIQTISSGFLFLLIQLKEFLFSLFTYSSLSIGSIIYATTGLHGLHVIIGLFLLSSYSLLCSSFLLSSSSTSSSSSPSTSPSSIFMAKAENDTELK